MQLTSILFDEGSDVFYVGSSDFPAHLSHPVQHVSVLDRKSTPPALDGKSHHTLNKS